MMDQVQCFLALMLCAATSALVRENFILAANFIEKRIEQIDLTTQQVHVIVENLARPLALSYDSVRELVYWSDRITKTIHSVNINQSDMKTLVSGVDCYGIDVEPVSGDIYYTDYNTRAIYRLSRGADSPVQIIKATDPTDVKLHLPSQKLVYTDYSDATISMADIDGNNLRVIISDDLSRPYGLTADDTEMCWCNTDRGIAECAGLDGSSRRTVYNGGCLYIDMSPGYYFMTFSIRYGILQVDRVTLETQTFGPNQYNMRGILVHGQIGSLQVSTPSTFTTVIGEEETSSQPTTPSDESTSSGGADVTVPAVVCVGNRGGGCEQYCRSSSAPHQQVTCYCSDSFVLSPRDNRSCDDPCKENNGGCSQLCRVRHQSVSCECFEGYVIDAQDNTQCTEVDECVDAGCTNGAACTDLRNRYYCDCTGDWKGVNCSEKEAEAPVITGIHPLQGPIAGGTRVTLEGRYFLPGVLVTLDGELLTYISSTRTSAVVSTLPVQATLIGTPRRVAVRFPGYEQLELADTFTYIGNPQLQSIQPLETNVIGGTTLTIAGELLDVIEEPQLTLTVVHTRNATGTIQGDSTEYISPCTVMSSNSMQCATPKIDVPQKFINATGDDGKVIKDIPLADESLAIYIGFRLDGVRSYSNLSDTKDLLCCHDFTFYQTVPRVSFKEFGEHVPDTLIHITGSGLLAGFRPADYNVSVGGGWVAAIRDVTDNEIICLPPDELTLGQLQTEGADGDLSPQPGALHTVDVVVRAGTIHTMLAGTLAYRWPEETTATPDDSDSSTIIIALSVALTVVTIVALTAIGCCVYKRRSARSAKESSAQPAHQADAREMRDLAAINPAAPSPQDDYLQPEHQYEYIPHPPPQDGYLQPVCHQADGREMYDDAVSRPAVLSDGEYLHMRGRAADRPELISADKPHDALKPDNHYEHISADRPQDALNPDNYYELITAHNPRDTYLQPVSHRN